MKFIEKGRWGAWDFDTPEVLDALNSEWSDFVECDWDGVYLEPVPEGVAQTHGLYTMIPDDRIVSLVVDGAIRFFRREK